MSNSGKFGNQILILEIWKSNFESKKKIQFGGLSSDQEIANYFAVYHKLNCSPNSEEKNEEFKALYLENKQKYANTFFFPNFSITTVMLEMAISKIKKGSTPGLDDICIEHLNLAHPSVCAILKSIFNIFIGMKEVPRDFGIGIVTPIPKFKGNKYNVTPDDFRGVTINSIISKNLNCVSFHRLIILLLRIDHLDSRNRVAVYML